ncbi:hypothetical protein CLV78_102277 [Aliiruegeria haliotis]|uniref:Flp pilus assembly pilin Flp n=1 Tax=Aliiruegeria haliotis TaxID=1280846 RepID=A0A2T0RVC7_9RHOB|nr:hypothetical protein CLV78_102277 [Aliiruegeria haliotis]
MYDLIKTFRDDEDGAVTVDWVVLTAALVGLAIALMAAVAGGVDTATNEITTEMDAFAVKTTFN